MKRSENFCAPYDLRNNGVPNQGLGGTKRSRINNGSRGQRLGVGGYRGYLVQGVPSHVQDLNPKWAKNTMDAR